ncbi:hypothetical protein C8Q77DRAFT_1074872 [Trametes polyzona]|nr:hypothetical protein C8Q77DRAFT_1074872 [Trametes polyzona]
MNWPSYEDLADWLDLNQSQGVLDDGSDSPEDPRRIDPRQLPPDILELDHTIEELEARLRDLRVERERLLAKRALVSRLPPEILSRIFELGVHESLELLETLCLVCHHWRDVALACPTLWSYILIDSGWGWRLPAWFRKLQAYLRRSQAAKLYIDLDLRYVDDIVDTQAVLGALKPEFSRCFSFTVWVSSWPRLRVVQENIVDLGPALENLYLQMDDADSEEAGPFNVLAQPCPRLTQVKLEQVPVECIDVPMPVLHSLSLFPDRRLHSSNKIGYPFTKLMATITASPLHVLRVYQAVFTLDVTDDLFSVTPHLYELSELEGVCFDHVDTSSMTLFLQATSLPSLSYLSVNGSEEMQWLTHIALTPERFPSLRLLDLRNFNISGTGLAPFIRAMRQLPQLTGLGLTSPSTAFVGSRLFEVLAAGPDVVGEWLLPQLEALCFQGCLDISGYEILQVVNARHYAMNADVAKITYLKISGCNLMPEALERLTTLVPTVRVL